MMPEEIEELARVIKLLGDACEKPPRYIIGGGIIPPSVLGKASEHSDSETEPDSEKSPNLPEKPATAGSKTGTQSFLDEMIVGVAPSFQ